MYDKELIQEILRQIIKASETVLIRFESIKTVNDFTESTEGMVKLDSICMLLIAIGESLKNIDKITNKELLKNYPEINWKGAKSMRDIISHHYFEIDAEIIFQVCKTNIDELRGTLIKILSDL
jgi:uncharacterized protein with HEPN domain